MALFVYFAQIMILLGEKPGFVRVKPGYAEVTPGWRGDIGQPLVFSARKENCL